MIVADTNLLTYLVVEGQQTKAARAVYLRDPVWVVPPLWRSEFLSVLVISVRTGSMTERQAQEAWEMAVALVGAAEQEPESTAVLRLAIRKQISAYDAQFVAVAEMLGIRLITGDRQLARRCPEHATLMAEYAGAEKG